MNVRIIFGMIVVAGLFSSCSTSKTVVQTAPASTVQTIHLALTSNPQADKYTNLEYGIRLNVQDERSNKDLIQLYDAVAISKPKAVAIPMISAFIPEAMRRYMRTMGFNMDADVETDYMMQVSVKEFHTDWLSGIGWNGTVIMNVKIYDHNRNVVYPSTEVVGRASVYGDAKSGSLAQQAINQAFANALSDIDWDRVAFFLHRSKSPSQEANKQVKGDGNTALEHLILHFNINSRPQGADVEWRVVSKTQDVKNQNYKYLETTPYESTESLGIPGLTYNNSGLVQIEIRVSKNGYYSQTKKYDVRSLIDEKEVSGMFRLVKEEE
ncbi:MAG: hypothetical protein ACI3YA_00910 [Alloprevotella sp.]